jgi:tRNA(Ile)-lysidine synthetase-like protein
MDLILKYNIIELEKFWFKNEHLWFNCSKEDDLLITKKYSDLLSDKIIDPSIGSIILYDQLPRHIYRGNQLKIDYYLKIALEHCNYLLQDIQKYNPKERCFILLPLRHTFEEKNINTCLQYINSWIETEDNPIYNRFYQASITSLSKINSVKETLYFSSKVNDNFSSILDTCSTKEIKFTYHKEIYDEYIYKEFSKNMIKNINPNIIISISGGVDSMVCSLLLYYYSINKNIKPIGVTINYANRIEQYMEIDMINQWLQLLQIDHHVREITEIKRVRDKNRDFYEKITRDIRFNLYKKLNGTIILGHNKDDSIENIFSNITKRKNYDNLLGMSTQSIEQEVEIFRPLLNIQKSDIINFAHKYNIPYVYDSTPGWSERGQMRDILIPQIKNFNQDILSGLIELSINYKEIYSIYKKNSIPNIIFEEKKCFFVNSNIYFIDYWRNILIIICKHYNCYNIKNKSIINLISNLETGNQIIISRQIKCQLINNNVILNIN